MSGRAFLEAIGGFFSRCLVQEQDNLWMAVGISLQPVNSTMKTQQRAPTWNLNYDQEPERRGNRTTVRLLDGRRAGVRTLGPCPQPMEIHKLGREFYKDAQDGYVVTFPMKEMHLVDGEVVWEKCTVLKSTTVDVGGSNCPRWCLRRSSWQR